MQKFARGLIQYLAESTEIMRTLSASSAIRRIFIERDNAPQRILSLYESVRAVNPELALSKTHFRENVIRQMYSRGELVQAGVKEDRRGKAVHFHGFRLKHNRDNREKLASDGIEWGRGGRSVSVERNKDE